MDACLIHSSHPIYDIYQKSYDIHYNFSIYPNLNLFGPSEKTEPVLFLFGVILEDFDAFKRDPVEQKVLKIFRKLDQSRFHGPRIQHCFFDSSFVYLTKTLDFS